MSAEQKVLTLLTGHGAKVFPLVAPEDETPPFIVYQFIGDLAIRSHGDPEVMDREVVQVSVWANKVAVMDSLARAINAVLNGNREDFKLCLRTGKFDAADPDSSLYRRVLEYTIWHQEGV